MIDVPLFFQKLSALLRDRWQEGPVPPEKLQWPWHNVLSHYDVSGSNMSVSKSDHHASYFVEAYTYNSMPRWAELTIKEYEFLDTMTLDEVLAKGDK